jgi:hypothetical protein
MDDDCSELDKKNKEMFPFNTMGQILKCKLNPRFDP